MRYKLFLLLFFGLNGIGFAQKFATPSEYLSYIKNEELNITKSSWEYTASMAHKNWIKANEAKKELIKNLQTAQKRIGKLKDGYNGDLEYKDQIIKYFSFFEKSLNQQFEKIIDIDGLLEQSDDEMDAFTQFEELVNTKLDEENKKAAIAYESFAQRHNVELVEKSEWSKKIKVYNDICTYYNDINLICFKLDFTDENLLIAIRNLDLVAIQQNKNVLAQYSEEGLAKIQTTEPYDGDYSVINAGRKVFEFYNNEARVYIPQVIDFLMYIDKFQNAKKTLDSKIQSTVTQEEKDNFDNMVKTTDEKIGAIKEMIFNNISDKNKVLNLWKTSGNDFIMRHIPKD